MVDSTDADFLDVNLASEDYPKEVDVRWCRCGWRSAAVMPAMPRRVPRTLVSI